MNIEEFRTHCLSIKGSEESVSLQDHRVLNYKVMGKVFVYLIPEPHDSVVRAYLKCDPERTVELRDGYKGITADKFKTLMWSWVALDSDVPDELIKELVGHSADEIVKKLPKYKQEEYRNL